MRPRRVGASRAAGGPGHRRGGGGGRCVGGRGGQPGGQGLGPHGRHCAGRRGRRLCGPQGGRAHAHADGLPDRGAYGRRLGAPLHPRTAHRRGHARRAAGQGLPRGRWHRHAR
nr:hypothetical protein [Acidovorax sp. SD340]